MHVLATQTYNVLWARTITLRSAGGPAVVKERTTSESINTDTGFYRWREQEAKDSAPGCRFLGVCVVAVVYMGVGGGFYTKPDHSSNNLVHVTEKKVDYRPSPPFKTSDITVVCFMGNPQKIMSGCLGRKRL